MSDFDNKRSLNWDEPPFAIDETPDPILDESDDAPDHAVEFDALRQDLSELQEVVTGLQTGVERVGRELYKHTTRMETLFTHVARLRSDVTTLLEANPP